MFTKQKVCIVSLFTTHYSLLTSKLKRNFLYFKKLLWVLFVPVLLFLVIFVHTPIVFAYPSYSANTDLVIAGPYDTATVGTLGWSVGVYGYREFITIGQKYRIRQNGTVSRIKIHTNNATGITGFYVSVWRKDGTTYDLVGTSNNLSASLVTGTTTTIDLSTPITEVQEGDYYGYRIEGGAINAFMARASVTGVETCLLNASDPTVTDFDWEGATCYSGSVLPIELHMQAPQVVFIGNSIIAGHPGHYSFLETTATTNIASTIEKQFSDLTGYSYQNMGVGGQTTTSIASRITADVVNIKPKLAVVEGGVNNLIGGGTKTTFINNWTSILDALQASDSISTIAVIKILPWTNGTNEQMQTRDDWNASLTSLAAGYSKVIVVDTSEYVGEFRAGGDEGNLWDIQDAYDSGGVHYTSAGHAQIAQAIADALDSSSPTISAVSAPTTSSSATVIWTTNENASTKVEYGLTSSYGSSTTEGDTTNGVTSHSVSLYLLESCKTYHYRVISRDTVLNQTTGSDNVFSTSGCPGPAGAPVCSDAKPGSAPTIITAIPESASSIQLTFSKATDPVTQYVLEYGEKSGTYKYAADNIGGKDATSYLVKFLQPGKTYYFRIRGGNSCATGTWSNEVSAKTSGGGTGGTPNITDNLEIVSSKLEPIEPDTSSKEKEGYSVNVKVININNEPVKGAKVTIHSKVQESTTDENGVARFENVESGDHRVLITYSGYEGEENISLTGDVKEFNLNVTVEAKSVLSNPKVLIGGGILVSIIFVLLILLLKSWLSSKKAL